VGGTPGYQYFLEAIRNPRHPEHKDMLEWAGGSFDPEAFDLEEANEALQAVQGPEAQVYHTDVVDFVFYPDMSPYLQFFLFRPDQEEKLARVVAKVEAGGKLEDAEWQDVERIGVLMFSPDEAGFTADLYLVRGQVDEDEVEDLVDAVDEMLEDLPSGMEGGILTLYWMEEFASYDFGPAI
ncbi:MAG: IS1096 element passenger TnpR family protein, partial [Anaerolineae bacterium]